MPVRTSTSLLLTAILAGVAACSQPEPAESAPETAATMSESAVEAGAGPQPSIGSPPPAGGGIPGSSNDNPAAAPPETSSPMTTDRQASTSQ